jgi:uncharacterized protein with HEPN domain
MQRDQQSLLDIVDSITLIFEYVTDWDDFVQSIKDQDAVIRRLTIIGEATKRLSMEFRASHPHVPWKDMAGRMQRLWEGFKGKRDARILVPLNKKYLDHTRSRDPISRGIRVENLL